MHAGDGLAQGHFTEMRCLDTSSGAIFHPVHIVPDFVASPRVASVATGAADCAHVGVGSADDRGGVGVSDVGGFKGLAAQLPDLSGMLATSSTVLPPSS